MILQEEYGGAIFMADCFYSAAPDCPQAPLHHVEEAATALPDVSLKAGSSYIHGPVGTDL